MPPSYRKYRNAGCRISDELMFKGYKSLMLENDVLQVILLLDKGGEPVRWLHKPTDTDFIWHTRMGLHSPHPLYPDYQMSYMGGWQEMLPEVSETHYYRGSLVHRGETAVTPWTYECLLDSQEELRVRLTNRLRSLPLVIEKTLTMRIGEASVLVEETVWNEAAVPMEFNWGHHLAYGAPFMDAETIVDFSEGSFVINPVSGKRREWPYAPGDRLETDLSRMAPPGTKKDLLAVETPDGSYRMRNRKVPVTLEVSWDRHIWPYVWYWQNFAADPNAPFFGSEYNIGLEPFNVLPKQTLAEAVASGTALSLEPYGSLSSWLKLNVVEGG
ncbi:DUF4432 family protein [Paenibacillus montanisoli]|uniref:DUF4432 domain-containing protein n=1 Tax=Paenibacillus montanisoli TaxID=2081970 RepID=A0A328U3G0_9BACL|nr:DUF4432 family protein [Paenibacillus montanisoli]RAP76592.1 hypothetical protein DL346_14605 [Paenibacillus montanisoli]